MRPRRALCFAATLVAVALAATAASGAEPQATPEPIVEPVGRVGLKADYWPGAQDREAFVVLEFDVLATGQLANIHLVDDGFHEQRFVDASIRALKRAIWTPRRVNGVAVDTTGVRQPFKFSITREPGVTPEFRKEARKVEALIKQGDYAGGEFHARWMLKEKVRLNYEYAMLEA